MVCNSFHILQNFIATIVYFRYVNIVTITFSSIENPDCVTIMKKVITSQQYLLSEQFLLLQATQRRESKSHFLCLLSFLAIAVLMEVDMKDSYKKIILFTTSLGVLSFLL